VSQNFGSRGLENKAGLKASWAETPKLEVPKCREDGSSENPKSWVPKLKVPNVPKYRKLKFRTSEKHRARQSSENLVKLKCLSFLFVLVINVVDCL
jgi:hypothetical protein